MDYDRGCDQPVFDIIFVHGNFLCFVFVSECSDISSARDCQGWKESGFCQQHEAMKYWCKKTCGFCVSGEIRIISISANMNSTV